MYGFHLQLSSKIYMNYANYDALTFDKQKNFWSENYSKDPLYFYESNENITGKSKNKANDKIFTEFVAYRPKELYICGGCCTEFNIINFRF